MRRQRTPTAADFKHFSRALDSRGDRSQLGLLGLLQRALLSVEPRGRINHRWVEPGGIEIVPQIVVRVNVAARSSAGVAMQPVPAPGHQPPGSARPRGLAQTVGIGCEQREQRHRIGAVPFAYFPRLVPADRPGRGQPQQRPPVLDLDLGLKARGPAAKQALGAIGQPGTDRSAGQARIDPVENPVPAPGPGARQPAAAAAQRGAASDQIEAALGNLCIHGKRIWTGTGPTSMRRIKPSAESNRARYC